MGTLQELRDLSALLAVSGARPVIHDVVPVERARDAFAEMERGDMVGKLVLTF